MFSDVFGSCRKLSEVVGSCRKLSDVVGCRGMLTDIPGCFNYGMLCAVIGGYGIWWNTLNTEYHLEDIQNLLSMVETTDSFI